MTAADIEQVIAPLVAEIARLREACEEQSRRFTLLQSCFRDVTLSKRDAAAYCDCSTRTLDRKVAAGVLATVGGPTRRFTIEELDRAIRAGVFGSTRHPPFS